MEEYWATESNLQQMRTLTERFKLRKQLKWNGLAQALPKEGES
jgi:hypothetical protein